jgi:excisionase family DNA binding protein
VSEAADRLLRHIRGRRDRDLPELVLATGDIAMLFGVSPATVRSWADNGRLKAFRTLGGHRRFGSHQILDFLEEERARITRDLDAELADMPAYSRRRRGD